MKKQVLQTPRIENSDKTNISDVAGTLVFNNDSDRIEYQNLDNDYKQVANSDDVALKVNKAGDTMTGPLILSGDPTSSLEAATKDYADMLVAGFNQFVVSAGSTAALTGTYNNGSSGVGATFTLTANGAFTLDGQAGALGNLYLLKDQSDASQNGIYRLVTVGTVSTQAVLMRPTNYDSPSEITAGDIVNVAFGSVNGGISFMQLSNVIAVGTSNITFSRWGGQSISLTGDVSGSGFSPVTTTLATVNSNVGSFGSATQVPVVTVDGKGRITAVSNTTISGVAPGGSAGGDLTGTYPNPTIGANKVTLAQMAQMATASFLGRNTALTGNVEVLSVATAKTMLNLAGSNSGDVTLVGESYLSISSQVITANAVNLSGTNVTGTLAAARFPALTGDITTSAGSLTTAIGAGKVTNAMLAGTISASKLVGTDITTVGTITVGTWSASFGAVSGANLTNLTAANISAGIAGINVTGNAGTATTLQNARTIGAVSFNGSANIVPQTIQTIDETSDTTCFILFANASGSQTSGQQPKTNSALTYDAVGTTLGSKNFLISRTDTTTASVTTYSTASVGIWDVGFKTGNNNFKIVDLSSNSALIELTPGGSPYLEIRCTTKAFVSTASTLLAVNSNKEIVNADPVAPYGISITGSAYTLQNARTIGGVNFDGSANIVPQTIQTVDETSDTTCFILFANASGSQTSGQQPKTNSGLTYNASTNALGVTTFVGALSGNATTATTLQNARTIGAVSFNGSANIVPQTIQTVDETSDSTCFLLFGNSSGSVTSGQQPKTNSGLTYDSTTNIIGFTDVSCANINNRQLFLSTGWTDNGAITITATGSNPVPTVVYSKVYSKRLGDFAIVKYLFESSGGTAGSGDYLFALPAGLDFDSTVTFYTATSANANANALQRACVGFGHISYSSSTTRGPCNMYAYDTQHFRVSAINSNVSEAIMGSGYWSFATAQGFGFTIMYPCATSGTILDNTARFSTFSVA